MALAWSWFDQAIAATMTGQHDWLKWPASWLNFHRDRPTIAPNDHRLTAILAPLGWRFGLGRAWGIARALAKLVYMRAIAK